MEIKTNNLTYTVKENTASWSVSQQFMDKIKVNINVSKVDCPTFDDLKSYIQETFNI